MTMLMRYKINHRQDLGIFKKGKTSSPIKSRGTLASDTLEYLLHIDFDCALVPILGFSEEDFLAGKSQSLIPRNDVSETYFGPLPDRDTADTTRCEMQKSIRHEDHRSQHGTDGKNGNVLRNAMRSPRTALDLSSDPDLESHTRNLLWVNFRSPTKATPGKRLWTLEDLHRLLRERETLWDSGKNDTQASQRSRISLNRDFLKRMSSSSPMRTATTAPMPPKKIQRTGRGHAIQREHRDPGIKSRATILSANSKTPPEYAHRQEESLRKVTRDWITPTKSSQHILPCEVLQNERPNMPDVPYSEGKDEVCRQVSCDAQSNSTFVTSSGHNEIIDDCFPLSPSKVDYAALEAACDAILASESNFFEPLQESFREISASSFEPGIPTRRPESALERKPSARDTHEDTHGYANDDRTCYYLSSHLGDRSWKAPASGAVRDVPLSRYITTIYDGGLFTENEQMQTRAEFTTHAEGCLECRLRQGSGSHCEPTRLQIDVSDNLRGFWQRRMLY